MHGETDRVFPNAADAVHATAGDPPLVFGSKRMRDIARREHRQVMAGERQSGRRREVVVLKRKGTGVGRGEDSSIGRERTEERDGVV